MGSPGIERALALAVSDVITSSQLRAAGLSTRIAERQVRAGRWQRPAREVYVPHARALTGLELGHVAAALVGTPVVVSGLVVLRELGLRWLPASDQVLALVDADVHTPSSRRVRLRRTAHLDALDTWRCDGLDMAPADRAVVDAARGLDSLRDVRGVVLGAVADNWANAAELRRILDGTQRNGSALCRRALLDADRGCASPPEAELVDGLVGCGRPFYVNPQIFLDGTLLGSPDVWLVGLGLGGEVESRERHGSDDDTETTYDRHERMTARGIELVHLSVRRIRRDVREAAGHLLTRADERSHLLRPEPPGLLVVPNGPLLR